MVIVVCLFIAEVLYCAQKAVLLKALKHNFFKREEHVGMNALHD